MARRVRRREPALSPYHEMALRAKHDPAFFSRVALSHDLWWMQTAILRALTEHKRVAVKACHASSKTFTAAEAVLWWISAFPDGIVITTAPTWTQVEKLMWREIHKAAAGGILHLPTKLNKTEIPLDEDNFAIGLSTNEGVRFQGFHGRVLIVVDEAAGVKADIWDAIEGIRAGGHVVLLVAGNPTVPSGPFYDIFAEQRTGWKRFTIDGLRTPNMASLFAAGGNQVEDPGDDAILERLLACTPDELDANPVPYLITRSWIAERYHAWGVKHPMWQARVRGQFPDQATDAVYPMAWVDRAARPAKPDTSKPMRAGIDVAGPGEDETVLCVRQGGSIVHLEWWSKPDPRGEVLAALRPYKARLERVNVDSAGIGHYFARHLEDAGLPVIDVNVSHAARNDEEFHDLKSEVYWSFREHLEADGVDGLTDSATQAQLTGVLYDHDTRGRVQIESKEKARKDRGVKSPDRAEAVILAFADVSTVTVGGGLVAF